MSSTRFRPDWPSAAGVIRRAALQPDVLAVAALAVLWGLFFWRLLTPVQADRVVFARGDFTDQAYPITHYQSERIWQGQLPLWNPYKSAGAPLAAEIQWGSWYPPRWVAILLAGPGGWSVEAFQMEIAAHYLLVSLLAFAFLRQLMRQRLAALAGAVVFSYGGFLTGYPMLQVSVLETAGWLPLALLGAHLAVMRPGWSIRGGLIGGLGLGLAALSGHPQSLMLMILLTLAYLIVLAAGKHRRPTWVAGEAILILAAMGGLAAIQLIPAVEMLRLTPRLDQYDFLTKGAGYQFADLLQVIWPGPFGQGWSALYPGVMGLLLAVTALFRFKRLRVFWAAALAVGLLLSVGANSALFGWFYVIVPGFGLFRQQERAALIAAMALSVLAAYGFDDLLAAARWRGRLPRLATQRRFGWLAAGHLAVTGLAALAISIGRRADPSAVSAQTQEVAIFIAAISLLATGWAAWLRRAPSGPVRALAILLLAVDLVTVGQRTINFAPDTPSNHLSAPRPPRLRVPDGQVAWHDDGSGLAPSYGSLYHIPDIYGASPLELDSIVQLRQIPVDRFWEVLAVRYAALPTEVHLPAQAGVQLLSSYPNAAGKYYNVFELRDPRPFAWLVYDSRDAHNSPAFARQIMTDPHLDLRQTAVTLAPLAEPLPGARPADSHVDGFRMVTPERMEMTVSTGTPALLTLATTNYPGWRASVNGTVVPVVDTYAGLIGVPIPAGDNQPVVVEFAPVLQGVSAAISLAALLALIGLSLWERRRSG